MFAAEDFCTQTLFLGGFEMAPFLSLSNSDKPIFKPFKGPYLATVQIPLHDLPQKVEIGNMLKT